MVVKKIQIRPNVDGLYPDILYPETSSDMVIDEASGKTVAERLANITSSASGTSLVDSEGFYTSDNVEGALEEIVGMIASVRSETSEFRVEVRDSDPVEPAIGRMWLRSDL